MSLKEDSILKIPIKMILNIILNDSERCYKEGLVRLGCHNISFLFNKFLKTRNFLTLLKIEIGEKIQQFHGNKLFLKFKIYI